MGRLAGIVVALASVAGADAQLLWVGAGVSTSWEHNPKAVPGRDWLQGATHPVTAFVALPLSEDTNVVLRGTDLPHPVLLSATRVDGRLRGLTVGIDYLLAGVLGQTVFSLGVGGYKLDLQPAAVPAGVEDWEVGWYAGIGEWFPLSRRARFTLDAAVHRTDHAGKPTIVALTAGLAFAF